MTPVSPMDLESPSSGGLEEADKLKIEKYKGYREQLSFSLTELWQIPEKTIEIGNTKLTNNGAITHIVHLMKREDIEDGMRVFGAEPSDDRVEILIARQFYAMHRDAISHIFRAHFHLNSRFEVEFYGRREKRRRTLWSKGGDMKLHSVPSTTLNSPSMSFGAGQSLSPQIHRLNKAMREYLESERNADTDSVLREMKRAEIMQLMEGMAMDNEQTPGSALKNRFAGNDIDAKTILETEMEIEMERDPERCDGNEQFETNEIEL